MNKKAIEYVRKTLKEYYYDTNKKNGNTIEEFIQNANYDIQDDVEEIFAKYLMPIPNNGERLMSQEPSLSNSTGQQLMIMNMYGIEQKLDELEEAAEEE